MTEFYFIFYNTPLHLAAYEGLEQIVEILLEKGAKIEETNKEKISFFTLSYETPLYKAVYRENISITTKLLEKGADPNNNKNKSRIPLHSACNDGNKQIVEILLEKGAKIEAKDKNNIHFVSFNETPLMSAVRKGKTEIVELLIKKGANVKVVNKDGIHCSFLIYENILHLACDGCGNEKIVSMLLEKKIDVNSTTTDGITVLLDYKTPLHYACENGKLETAKLLIEHKANIKHRASVANRRHEHDGMTAIHFAASSGNVELVKLLISKGVEIDEKTFDGVSLYCFLIILHSILHVKMKKELALQNIFFRKELILIRKLIKDSQHFSLHAKIITLQLLIFLLIKEQTSIARTKKTILFFLFCH